MKVRGHVRVRRDGRREQLLRCERGCRRTGGDRHGSVEIQPIHAGGDLDLEQVPVRRVDCHRHGVVSLGKRLQDGRTRAIGDQSVFDGIRHGIRDIVGCGIDRHVIDPRVGICACDFGPDCAHCIGAAVDDRNVVVSRRNIKHVRRRIHRNVPIPIRVDRGGHESGRFVDDVDDRRRRFRLPGFDIDRPGHLIDSDVAWLGIRGDGCDDASCRPIDNCERVALDVPDIDQIACGIDCDQARSESERHALNQSAGHVVEDIQRVRVIVRLIEPVPSRVDRKSTDPTGAAKVFTIDELASSMTEMTCEVEGDVMTNPRWLTESTATADAA